MLRGIRFYENARTPTEKEESKVLFSFFSIHLRSPLCSRVYRRWAPTFVLLDLSELPTKCQPLCFGAGEQHLARPERVLVQNRRYGVDLRSANAHYA